jgi:hypothetical protein
MNTHNHAIPLKIHTIGATALSILSNSRQGSVLASVTNAVYLQNEHGDLCWLISTTAPMHQRAMQLAAPLPRLKVGGIYKVVDHTLSIDNGKLLDFHHSLDWLSPTVASTKITSRSRLTKLLLAVIDQLLEQHVIYGLGSLIVPILHLSIHPNEALEVNFNNRFVEKSWPAVHGMILANLANDTSLIITHAKSLVGLGEGLTPSGDDFLGGFFFARQVLYQYYPTAIDLPFCTYSEFILHSKPLTNLISYTILKDHVGGNSVAPLHQFTNGLLRGESFEQLYLHAEKIIALGHSTGWDLLTGFLAGMSVTFAR